MTFLYPERPQPEAAPDALAAESAPALYGQVSREHPQSPPKPLDQTYPNTIPDPGPSGEVVHHIIIGSPEAVRETIHRLHLKRYVEQAMWTGPIEIGPDGINITQSQGQILFYLMRLRSLDVPAG